MYPLGLERLTEIKILINLIFRYSKFNLDTYWYLHFLMEVWSKFLSTILKEVIHKIFLLKITGI